MESELISGEIAYVDADKGAIHIKNKKDGTYLTIKFKDLIGVDVDLNFIYDQPKESTQIYEKE